MRETCIVRRAHQPVENLSIDNVPLGLHTDLYFSRAIIAEARATCNYKRWPAIPPSSFQLATSFPVINQEIVSYVMVGGVKQVSKMWFDFADFSIHCTTILIWAWNPPIEKISFIGSLNGEFQVLEIQSWLIMRYNSFKFYFINFYQSVLKKVTQINICPFSIIFWWSQNFFFDTSRYRIFSRQIHFFAFKCGQSEGGKIEKQRSS